MSSRRVAVALLTVGAVLLTVGTYVLVTGRGGPTVYASNGIRLSVPDGFAPIEGLDAEPELLAAAGWSGPSRQGGTRTAVFLDVFCAGAIETVVDTMIADSRRQLPSHELVRRRGVEVPGADAATRIEAVYRQPPPTDDGDGGDVVELTRLEQVAVSGRVAVRLAVVGPSDGLDRERAAAVLDSLAVRPTDELATACTAAEPDPGRTGSPAPTPSEP